MLAKVGVGGVLDILAIIVLHVLQWDHDLLLWGLQLWLSPWVVWVVGRGWHRWKPVCRTFLLYLVFDLVLVRQMLLLLLVTATTAKLNVTLYLFFLVASARLCTVVRVLIRRDYIKGALGCELQDSLMGWDDITTLTILAWSNLLHLLLEKHTSSTLWPRLRDWLSILLSRCRLVLVGDIIDLARLLVLLNHHQRVASTWEGFRFLMAGLLLHLHRRLRLLLIQIFRAIIDVHQVIISVTGLVVICFVATACPLVMTMCLVWCDTVGLGWMVVERLLKLDTRSGYGLTDLRRSDDLVLLIGLCQLSQSLRWRRSLIVDVLGLTRSDNDSLGVFPGRCVLILLLVRRLMMVVYHLSNQLVVTICQVLTTAH